jgi:CubicO group peptidase (beta-lactamase class C family)
MKQPLSFYHLKRSIFRAALFLSAFLSCQDRGFSQLTPGQQKLADSLFSQWDTDSTPGMELIIIQHGNLVMDRSYGLANLEAKLPNSSGRRIWVASVAKQFTGLAIALLIDQHRISLDDDIRKYLPELPAGGEPVKIRHLVYHSSGIRDGFTLTAMSFKQEDEYTNANVLKYLSRQRGRNFRPGERFEYNNSGYVLLAMIVERVSGMSFPGFTRKFVFEPLGMDHTNFVDSFPLQDTNMAMGYSAVSEAGRKAYSPSWFRGKSYGSSGLVTTARDLAKWDRVFYEPVFGKSVQQLQVQTGKLNNGRKIPYAFGLEIAAFRGKTAITHSGADPGYKAEIARFPGEELTIICLANTEDAYNNTDRLFKLAEGFTRFEKQAEPAGKDCKPVAGAYLDQESLASMRFVREEGGLSIAGSSDGYYQQLVPRGICAFGVKDIQTEEYLFRSTRMHYTSRGGEAEFYPVAPKPLPLEDLKAAAGEYYSPELKVSYHLFEKEGSLFLKFFDVYDVPLTSFTGGVFAGEFLGTNILEFSTDHSGKVKGMEFSRDGIHRLLFEKK